MFTVPSNISTYTNFPSGFFFFPPFVLSILKDDFNQRKGNLGFKAEIEVFRELYFVLRLVKVILHIFWQAI